MLSALLTTLGVLLGVVIFIVILLVGLIEITRGIVKVFHKSKKGER